MNENSDQPVHDNQLLSAYLDGELTEDELRVVKDRLQNDNRAQEMVAGLRFVSEAVRSLPRHELGRDLRYTVIQQAAARVEPAAAVSSVPRRWVWAAAALAAALLLMVYQPEGDLLNFRIANVSTNRWDQSSRAGAVTIL